MRLTDKLFNACVILIALPHGAFAADPPSRKYKYEDHLYSTSKEACDAVAKARREDKSVDNPYDRVIGFADAGDKFRCKLADSKGNENEQEYGSAELASKEQSGEEKSDDPCLSSARSKNAEPNQAICPRSWRAWSIKSELHRKNPGKWPVVKLQQSAIAVSEGVTKAKRRVVLITTNNKELDAALRERRAFTNEPGEELGYGPQPGEHAEDVAVRWFEDAGVDRNKGVDMGTEPKACRDKCAINYARHPWIRHERIPKSK